MAATKKGTAIRKIKKVNKTKSPEATNDINASEIDNPNRLPIIGSFLSNRRNFTLILLVLAVVALLIYKKNLLVAAMVNNQPITSLDLQQRLNQLHGSEVLNQMVNEKILEQEAAKKGIFITPKQLNDKVVETENQYGGAESFKMLLTQQGIKRDAFVGQIKYQLIVEELYKNEITPTDQEIKQFMDDNKNNPQATDEAKFKEIAQKSVKQQKLNQSFNQKFQELKQAAKVQIF